MPHRLHEAIVALLHGLPQTVPGILVVTGDLSAAAATDARAERINFADAQPVEARPDLVVLCAGQQVLIVEVQLRVDPAKKLSWPVYAALARQRFGGTARVVVVTASARVARWAAEPIQVGGPSDLSHAVVLGPDTVPCITEIAQAIAAPGAAVLSAVVHAHSPTAVLAAMAGLHAVDTLAQESKPYYNDLICGLLSAADLANLEAMMEQQEPARPTFIAVPKGYRPYQYAEARAEARGEARGEARALRQTLLAIAAARGVVVPPDVEARIAGCNDSAQLNRWIVLAATAAQVDQIFDVGHGVGSDGR